MSGRAIIDSDSEGEEQPKVPTQSAPVAAQASSSAPVAAVSQTQATQPAATASSSSAAAVAPPKSPVKATTAPSTSISKQFAYKKPISPKKRPRPPATADSDDDDFDSDDSDDDVPLAALAKRTGAGVAIKSGVPQRKVPKAAAKPSRPVPKPHKSKSSSSRDKPAKKKARTEKDRKSPKAKKASSPSVKRSPSASSTSSSGSGPKRRADVQFSDHGARLFDKAFALKPQAVESVLVRWQYSGLEWPCKEVREHSAPDGYYDLPGVPGVSVGIGEEVLGEIKDIRPPPSKAAPRPTFKFLYSLPSTTLAELWGRAIRNQKKALVEAEGEEAPMLRGLDQELKQVELFRKFAPRIDAKAEEAHKKGTEVYGFKGLSPTGGEMELGSAGSSSNGNGSASSSSAAAAGGGS